MSGCQTPRHNTRYIVLLRRAQENPSQKRHNFDKLQICKHEELWVEWPQIRLLPSASIQASERENKRERVSNLTKPRLAPPPPPPLLPDSFSASCRSLMKHRHSSSYKDWLYITINSSISMSTFTVCQIKHGPPTNITGNVCLTWQTDRQLDRHTDGLIHEARDRC